MPRKNRPFDPAAAARAAQVARSRDFESVGLQGGAANLAANTNVVVDQVRRADLTRGVRGNERRATRMDIFAELYSRRQGADRKGPRCLSTGSLQAARRLEEAMVARLGLGQTPDATGGRGFGPRTPVTDRMLDAGDEVREVLALLFERVGARQAGALLTELIEPQRVHTSAPQRWRLVVALVTGTRAESAQADRVRDAADALAAAYLELDRRRAVNGWRRRAA